MTDAHDRPETDESAAARSEQADAPVDSAQDETADQGRMDEELAKARSDVDSLTGDLQRLQAEYLNYKRRVDRDRRMIEENAAFKALMPVVEVLDAIDRAREAGDLEGGFKTVADQLERAVGQSGVRRFGEPGDPFDPTRHDALSHLGEDPEVEVTTVKVVAKSGYTIGERVVRAAQVLVVAPAELPAGEATDGTAEPEQGQQGESAE